MPGSYFAMMFYYLSWKDSKNEVSVLMPTNMRLTMPSEYVSCPYVFGDKPERFNVRFPVDGFGLQAATMFRSFDIEIPPIGRPAPPLPPRKVMVGPCELTFTPKKWRGPTFALPIEVTAKGIPEGQQLMLRQEVDPFIASLNITTFSVVNGETSQFKAMTSTQKFTARFVKEDQEKIRLVPKSTKTGTASAIHMDLKTLSGKVLAEGFSVSGMGQYLRSPDGNFPDPFKFNGVWIGASYDRLAEDNDMMGFNRSPSGMTPGLHEITIYRTVRTAPIEVKNLYPDMQKWFKQ